MIERRLVRSHGDQQSGGPDDRCDSGQVPELLSPEFHANPYPTLAALRERGPVFYRGADDGYLVLSHAAISALAHSPHLSATLRPMTNTGFAPKVRKMLQRVSQSFLKLAEYNMAQADPPKHTRLRGQATRSFSTRLMEPMRARISTVADELLTAVTDQGAMELIGDYAYVLPATIIMDLLGIPEDDREQVREWTDDIVSAVGGMHASDSPDSVGFRAMVSATALIHYSNGLVRKKRQHPQSDFISELVQLQQVEDGRVTPLEVIGQSGLLLFAAHETTTNLIANGVLALLNHPEQLAKLRSDPDLINSAVHEMLRYDSPTLMFPRLSTGDVAVPGGTTIPGGAQVQMVYAAANRDPDHYEDPDRFDINRGATDYMSFGFDRHRCLGRHLALIEGGIAISMLIERFPELRLADGAELEYHHNMAVRALKTLPLTF